VWAETKRQDHGISRNNVLGASDDLRTATSLRIRFAHFSARHFHAAHFPVGIHFHT
jgi:hypothetical protein